MTGSLGSGALLYEGKAKQVFSGGAAGVCAIRYKDSATAFNGEKKENIAGKGRLNCHISNIIFRQLARQGVPTHFIRELEPTAIEVWQVEIIPLEVIVRNAAAGSFASRFGVAEGCALEPPTLEFCYKQDELGDPMINDSQILALGLATAAELATVSALALRINALLLEFFARAGLRLIDFKIEFGRRGGDILLADEISPDTCRLWDMATGDKLDKDRFRHDMGAVLEAYQEVSRRLDALDDTANGLTAEGK